MIRSSFLILWSKWKKESVSNLLFYCQAKFFCVDDPSDDIQMIAYQILTKLAGLVPLALLSHLERLTDKFEGAFNKILKALGSKQEGERANDCLRAFIKAVLTISKIPESDEIPKFKEFYSLKVAQNEKCKEFIQQINSA